MKLCMVSLSGLNCHLAKPGSPGEARGVRGGAELQTAALGRELADRGHEVTVVVTNYSGQAREAPSLSGLPLLNAYDTHSGVPGLRFLVPRWRGLHRALAQADADLYYQRGGGAITGQTAYFCRKAGKAFVFGTSSDTDTDPGRTRLNRRDFWLYRWGLSRADRIVTQHEEQKRRLHAGYGLSSIVIGGIAHYASGSPRPPELPPIVLWLGNFRRVKRPEIFLDLAARFPDTRFEMVGGTVSSEPHSFHAAQEHAQSLPNVVFHGPIADPRPFLARAWVLVNTSSAEGFPTSFLEAWAFAVPTLSFVDPGGTVAGAGLGVVVSRPEELAAELGALLASPQRRNALGRRAREYALREHHPKVIAASYERLFTEVLEERHRRG